MASPAQLLIVSPDTAVLDAAQRCLLALGHAPHLVRTVREGRRALARTRVDIVCLDTIVPPDEAERFWKWATLDGDADSPLLLMIGPPSAAHVPSSLPPFFEATRHAIVAKPVEARAFEREVARLLAAVAKPRGDADLVRVGNVALDGATNQLLFAGGGSLRLTPIETRLLRCLMQRPGEYVSSRELLELVWEYPKGTGGPEVVRSHVSNARRKLRGLGEDPQLLHSLPYRGYSFQPNGHAQL